MDAVRDLVALIFQPLEPLIVPVSQLAPGSVFIPEGLVRPLGIWIISGFPDLPRFRVSEAEHGSQEENRKRITESLWKRASVVLSRPIPAPVLDEIASSSGLDSAAVAHLARTLAPLFSEARFFRDRQISRRNGPFPRPDEATAPGSAASSLTGILDRMAAIGPECWKLVLTLLMARYADIEALLPEAHAAAGRSADPERFIALCDAQLEKIYSLLDQRCMRIASEVGRLQVDSRLGRRRDLWISEADLTAILSLIRFAVRTGLHEEAARSLKKSAGRASRAQFEMLVAEDLVAAWPAARWSDEALSGFEEGNRRLRRLAAIGASFGHARRYRDDLERVSARYRQDLSLGLSQIERLRVDEILLRQVQLSLEERQSLHIELDQERDQGA